MTDVEESMTALGMETKVQERIFNNLEYILRNESLRIQFRLHVWSVVQHATTTWDFQKIQTNVRHIQNMDQQENI